MAERYEVSSVHGTLWLTWGVSCAEISGVGHQRLQLAVQHYFPMLRAYSMHGEGRVDA